jgi:hypothetical protein
MSEDLKEWQKGYDLEYLKSLQARYDTLNEKIISPFMQMKKNNIAEYLSTGGLILTDAYDVLVSQSNKPSKIKVYSSKNHILAVKQANDIELSYVQIRDLPVFISYLNSLTENLWLLWLDDGDLTPITQLGFTRIGSKINSFGDCFGVYYLEKKPSFSLFDQEPICLYTDPHEIACAFKFTDFHYDITALKEKVSQLNFANHYSNYNADGGWSAISLRGYSADPNFIIKPLEMNDKWHEKHKGQDFHIQDTSVYDLFPEVKEIIKQVSKTAKVDRVRIMKLDAGKVIEQHTDLVDSECGIGIGEVPRFHIPIDTHDDCWFEVYGMTGKEVFKFKEGELWYLDTRKPHRVVNNGKTRIHLVFDLYTDADLLNKLKQRKLT